MHFSFQIAGNPTMLRNICDLCHSMTRKHWSVYFALLIRDSLVRDCIPKLFHMLGQDKDYLSLPGPPQSFWHSFFFIKIIFKAKNKEWKYYFKWKRKTSTLVMFYVVAWTFLSFKFCIDLSPSIILGLKFIFKFAFCFWFLFHSMLSGIAYNRS